MRCEVKCAHSAGAQSCATVIFHTAGMICCLQRRDLPSQIYLNVGRLREWPPTYLPMAVALASPNSVKRSQLEIRLQGLSDCFRAMMKNAVSSLTERASKEEEHQAGRIVIPFDLAAG